MTILASDSPLASPNAKSMTPASDHHEPNTYEHYSTGSSHNSSPQRDSVKQQRINKRSILTR
ncbi:hypothetical protein BJX99DRAFT_240109 [Aspergillus californicus]